MTLSDLSIKRPVFAWMLMFGLIVFGAISLGRLGVSKLPDVDFPQLSVSTSWEGAAPEVLESEIVDRVEEEVVSVEGIRDITSVIRQGSATTTIEFGFERDVDAALQEVQSKISTIRMPKGADPATISKSNPYDNPIMHLGVNSTRSIHDLIVYVDTQLRDKLEILPGVGEVVRSGFTDRNLRLWVKNDKLKQYELTILDVLKAVEVEHIETAAGYMENSQQELNIRVMGEGRTPEEIENILITRRGSRPIYNTRIRVGDVARVEDGLGEVRRITRISGAPGVGLGIKKQRGANAIEVSRAVRECLKELEKILPKDIRITLNFDTTPFIEDAIHETEFTLILSALITGFVCWFFLGSWSSTVNILLSIPTSIVGTFIIIYFMGFTLNFFTLLGLTLAVGIVVDDAIMVLENIVRHRSMGKDRMQAARDGAREITFAAVAASVAVMAIFLPVLLMKGLIGRFFFQFGVTISAAVALSLLEAITLTPMRCSQFLETGSRRGKMAALADHAFQRVAGFYARLLILCLQRRWTVLTIATILFGSSILLINVLRRELVPSQDMNAMILAFETPVGSSLQYSSEKVLEAEKILKNQPEVIRYLVAIGGPYGGESNRGSIFVTLTPKSQRRRGHLELANFFRTEMSKVPTLRVYYQDLSQSGFSAQRGGASALEFNVRGPDYEVLDKKVREIIQRLETTGLVIDVNTDYRKGMPEVRVWPDRARAAYSGVSMEALGDTIQAAVGGIRQGKYTHEGRRYDVRIRLEEHERLRAEDIEALQVRTEYGELIPLMDVAHVETVSSLFSITRRMRERSITISANVPVGKSQADAVEAAESISRGVLPEGYRLFTSGTAQAFKDTKEGLLFALLLGIVISYMVLASQFNSFIHPVTVLLALPFSLSGAFLALFIGNQSLNLYSGIGIVLLMGIVKKNSILLVEFTNKKRYEDGLPLYQAILTAAPIRLRPILMTSFSTLAAAIPPALALGPGSEIRIPMAITVIGGVFVSTAFTLLVVPCAYSLLARLEKDRPAMPTHDT